MSDGARVVTALGAGLDADGFLARVELPDGTELGLVPQLGGALRITRGRPSGWATYDEEWTFTDHGRAIAAFVGAVLDPTAALDGWIRYRGEGGRVRRRSACPTCERILEYGNDEDGIAEPVPACSHATTDDTLD
ncbi:MAG TPA: hypothetical protein VF076_07065 [Acidimicrobiales bacterium]